MSENPRKAYFAEYYKQKIKPARQAKKQHPRQEYFASYYAFNRDKIRSKQAEYRKTAQYEKMTSAKEHIEKKRAAARKWAQKERDRLRSERNRYKKMTGCQNNSQALALIVIIARRLKETYSEKIFAEK